MDSIISMMRTCHLFDDIPEEKYDAVLTCLDAKQRTVPKDSLLLRIGDSKKRAGVVLSGVLRISLYSEDGNPLTVDLLKPGRVFGETLVCSMDGDSPVQIDTVTDAQVLFLDFDPLLLQQKNTCPHKTQMTANLLREMGRSALFLTQKMRILAQNRLRNRIKLYLQMMPLSPNNDIQLDMGRSALADYLCVDRSALSRELGRMQKEGILAFHGSTIHILQKEFLVS